MTSGAPCPIQPHEPCWCVPEAAERHGLDPQTLRRRIERGELVAVRTAGAE
jgi:hypothetical protein